MAQLRLIQTDQPSEWAAVLSQSFPYDFYHLPGYHVLAEQQGEGTAHLFVWSEDGWTIALPLLLRSLEGVPGINGEGTGWRDATSVYGYAGPIASQAVVPEAIREHFRVAVREALRELRVVSVFSRLHPLLPEQGDWLAGLGECMALAKTVSLDLTLPSEAQRGRYRRNHKEGIGKLRRQGIACVYDPECERLPDFIDLYHETMRRVGAAPAYFFPAAYFAALRCCLGRSFHLFGCVIEGRYACGGLFVECNGILQFHLGGTRDDFLRMGPMKLLFDEVREWATARGLRVLHLGGGATSRPDDSLLHFKTGFSDRQHDFRVWRYTLAPEVYDRFCRGRARWNDQNRLCATAPDFFPAYRCPTVPNSSEPEA